MEKDKNVVRSFGTHFENNQLKNETRELVTNVTTTYNLFEDLWIIWGKHNRSFNTNFLYKKMKGISKVFFKVKQ